MRILIISDTHGRHGGFDLALNEVGKIDFLLHLGDTEGGEHYIEAAAGCPAYIVAGNNDFFSYLPREIETTIDRYHFFMAHGHNYQVSLGPERMIEEGKSRNADVIIFGHTHKPFIEKVDGIMVMNPGSISYPRQEGRRGSYILMTIDENGKMECEIHYI